jgi:proteasome lid subunit RPN8/RPN11
METTAERDVLVLPDDVRERLRELALADYPREACGLLLGRVEGIRRVVELVHPARNLNVERAHDRYELDPRDQLAAERAAREGGREVLGVWHTHPDHPATPSETDRAAAWSGWSYLILSVVRGELAELRSWRLDESTRTFLPETTLP